MPTKDTNQTMSKLERRSKYFQISANIFTFIGVLVAVIYYLYTTDFNREQEKRKNAIEAIGKIYSNDFINKYSTIIALKRLEFNDQIEAFNLVFNSYYVVSVIYNNNIGDKEIITKAIEHGIKEFTLSTVYQNTKDDLDKNSIVEIDKMIQSFGNNK